MSTQAPERQPPRSRWAYPWAVLLVLEYVAIASGYVLLGWLALTLTPEGRPLTLWPAGGFALAMIFLRGTSRWPAILVGSAIISCGLGLWRWWVPESGIQVSPSWMYAVAFLTSVARTLSTVVGAWLLRGMVGAGRWPHTLRGVIGFITVAGLVHPGLVAFSTHSVLLLGGLAEFAPVFLREAWIWFAANTVGSLIVTPLILAFADAPAGRPPRPRWEALLLGVSYGVAGYISIEVGHWLELGTLLTYPTVPMMLWATLRFGARGAVFNNLVWLVLLLISAFTLEPNVAQPARDFLQIQVRIVVLATAILVLAATVEERQQMQHILEKERQALETRVAERTQEISHYLSLLHSSLDSTADGLLVVGRGGRITVMNQRFIELWAIPRSIVQSGDDGQALVFVHDRLVDPHAFRSRVEFLYANPELESEDEFLLKDGHILQRSSRPQRLGDEVIGRVWSFRDITEQRRAEAERDRLLVEEQRARKEAERAFHEARKALGLRDEFLTVAAHEMRTPLTSMKIQVQHLLRMLGGTDGTPVEAARLRPAVATILRQLQRYQELSEQLLDITCFTSREPEPHYEPLDFREAVASQLRHHAEAAERVRSVLAFEDTGPIPGESDLQSLQRIVSHLLSNALKFGAGHPIRVRLEADEDRVYLQVSDDGIGIAPADHARIFERLERAVDARHYGGLGLGLWLVRQSVESLGGNVAVESEPGRGSTFTIELPRTRPLARSEEEHVFPG